MSHIPTIEEQFNQRFASRRIRLPPEDIAQRRRGRLRGHGQIVWYLFCADKQGEYLDYYTVGGWGGDEHVRLRDHRRPKTLPSLKWAYSHSDDPEEAARIAAEFYAENQRVKEMLTAKGFGLEGDESGGALVNHHLLTHPTPVSDGNLRSGWREDSDNSAQG